MRVMFISAELFFLIAPLMRTMHFSSIDMNMGVRTSLIIGRVNNLPAIPVYWAGRGADGDRGNEVDPPCSRILMLHTHSGVVSKTLVTPE